MQSQQPTQEDYSGGTDAEETESLFELMKGMLDEIKSARSAQKEIQDIEEDDDYALFESLFNSDNTPVDWNSVYDVKKGLNSNQSNVADRIYNTVLQETGDPIRATNAVKVAKHESAFNPSITNSYNMLGLFQFSPPNQKKYGVTSSTSVEDQARAWVKYMKDNRIPTGQEGVGQLAPGYLGRDVLYKKGTKAYNANKALDKNKDGAISATETNQFYNI